MSRLISGLICVHLAVALWGCTSTDGFPERPEAAEETKKALLERYFAPKADVFGTYNKSDTDKNAYRNEVILGRMAAIDIQYGLFKEAIYEEAVNSNLSTDIAGVVLGAAGTAVTGADGSRVMSFLSTVNSGTGTAINKNLYYERTLPALLALMDAKRSEVKADILEGLDLDHKVYPLTRGIADLERYLYAGSIPGAISEMNTAAGDVNIEAQSRLTRLVQQQRVIARLPRTDR